MSQVHVPLDGGRLAQRASALAGRRGLVALPWLAALLCCALIWRRAWIGDDAFITLRALDNLLAGHGLLSNPPERVLGFTHPLWALAMLVPRTLGWGGYWSAIGTSLLASFACVFWIATRAASGWGVALLACSWLAGSLAFVDFSTGGLENPLAHLLLALFFTAHARDRLSVTAASTWLLAALIVLNRHDHALLVLPALVCALVETVPGARTGGLARRLPLRLAAPIRQIAPAFAYGALPLAAWFSFAIVYYGFALPNTVHAKLNTALPPYALLDQGARYFADAASRDPQTLVVIAIALIAAVRERSRAALGTAVGLVLYLAYVARIGGDFMTGRFFTAPLVVSVVWLAARALREAPRGTLLVLGAIQVWLVALHPISLSASETRPSCTIGPSGIVIERQCYARLTGLARNLGAAPYLKSERYQRGRGYARARERVVKAWNAGLIGYAAGPGVHVIDVLALTDPLLARVPYPAFDYFRIGHFERELPKGYRETLRTGRNALENRCLRAYYDVLSPVIRGPLFTRARWRAIVELHLGRHEHLVQKPCPRPR